jgi:hypothetical protein
LRHNFWAVFKLNPGPQPLKYMFSFLPLCALVLSAPAQSATQAVDYLPADTIFCLELSAEPFDRLGAETIMAQMFAKSDLAEAITPFQNQLQQGMDGLSAQLGFDLPSLLMSSRFYLGIPRSMAMNQGGQLVLAADLDPAIAEAVNFAEMLNQSGFGAWWQTGDVLLGVMSDPEFEQVFDQHAPMAEAPGQMSAFQAKDLDYLKQLIRNQIENPAATLAGVPSWKAMTERMRNGDEVFGAWLMAETMDREFFQTILGEEFPKEADAVLALLGIHKIRGMSWSSRLAGAMVEDRMMIYGPGFGQSIFPAEMLELVNLPELLKMLPHDSARAQMMAADFGAMGEILVAMIEVITELEGSPPPPEAEQIFDVVLGALAEIGPVTTGNTRMEDFDRNLPGDVWVQVRHADKLQQALDMIPDGLRESLENGLAFGAGAPTIKLAIQGNRLVLFESSAEPSTESLRAQAAYLPIDNWVQQFDPSTVAGFDFVHPEVLVQGLNVLRTDGDDILRALEAPDFPLKFADLPSEAVTRGLMQPMATVSIADAQGLYMECRSPFGIFESSMLIAMPQLVEMMDLFGVTVLDEIEEEEF